MALKERGVTIADLSEADLAAALSAPVIPAEERERRHPQLAWMRARSAEAIRELQRQGILNAEGELVRPDYLPADMQPGSQTEC